MTERARFYYLVSRACDRAIDAGEFRELEQLLQDNAALVAEYVRYANLHLGLDWEYSAEGGRPLPADWQSAQASAAVEPARRASRISTAARLYASLACAALVVIIGLTVMAILRSGDLRRPGAPDVADDKPAVSARVVELADCRWSDDRFTLAAGQELPPGARMRLQAGYAEIAFSDGASVVLAGPATFVVDSSNSSQLLAGKLTARVPPTARGFTVATPTARVIDLGTAFGVEVDAAGETEVHVFDGRVQMVAHEPQAVPVELGANESARIDSNSKLSRDAASPDDFVQRIPPRAAIPVHSTGVKLSAMEPDPHWQIVAASNEPEFEPRAAVVHRGHPDYLSATPAAGWITYSAEVGGSPADCEFTFRTTFDLSAFDHATARLQLQYAVDDQLKAVRLNGKTIEGIPPKGDAPHRKLTPLAIDEGFVAGENVLEIVVYNEGDENLEFNPMGLLLQIRGTARRIKAAAE